jgi:flagella basal body P-ring formation protein FlgA
MEVRREFEMEFNHMLSTRPDTYRPTGILMVALVLAVIWFALGARGQSDPNPDAPVVLPNAPVPEAGAERFVPNPKPFDGAGTLEVQRSAQITGDQIRIRQVVRWADTDAASFTPIADLVIDHFDGPGNRKVSLDEIRSTLSSAGANVALIRFTGASSCMISRVAGDPPAIVAVGDDHAAVKQWIDQNSKTTGQAQQNVANGSDVADAECSPFHSLRDRALIDLSQRLDLPVDQLQVTFDPKDSAYLKLAEPTFRFQLDPQRVRDLGNVSWDVTIMSGNNQQKITLTANARCWQRELAMAKAASFKQVLQDDDVIERRVLVDHIPDDQVLTRTQIVGQQAARDLKPGTVLTARLIDPVPLARIGQYVTITLNQGGVQVKTVARAMETGSYGQTIRLKNEQTDDVFEATLTGPQTASMGPAPARLASDSE